MTYQRTYDNGLTNSGAEAYVNEGRDAFYAGEDGNISPYERLGCLGKPWNEGGRGWKGCDWIAGFEDARKNCTPEQRVQRFGAREILLKKRVDDAHSKIDDAITDHNRVLVEWENHNIENTDSL